MQIDSHSTTVNVVGKPAGLTSLLNCQEAETDSRFTADNREKSNHCRRNNQNTEVY